MTARVLLINGPKRVGKTTVGNLIADRVSNVIRINMADRLKFITNSIYNIRQYGQIAPPDFMEAQKDIPMDVFGGLTYRQALIYVSECLIKPMHGDCIFGHWAAENMDKLYKIEMTLGQPKSDILFVVADSGFSSEIVPIIEKFGADSIALVRLSGMNATFDGDSRSYVSSERALNYSGNPGKFPIGPTKISPESIKGGFAFECDFVNHEGDPSGTANNIIAGLRDNCCWDICSSDQRNTNCEPGL